MDKLKEIFANYEEYPLESLEYEKEYITFSRNDALNAICELIKNAKDIKIFHKPLGNDNYSNKVIDALNNNEKAKITYYSYFNENDLKNTKSKLTNPNIIFENTKYHIKFHHKELVIDDKILVFGSFNFLTNDLIDPNEKMFNLENVCFWIKRGGNK